MASYLLMYDLVNEKGSHDYKPLYAALQKAGAHRTQLSAWLVASSGSAKALHDAFKPHFDKDDRLWVTRLRKDQYWYSNAMAGTNKWIDNNPPD